MDQGRERKGQQSPVRRSKSQDDMAELAPLNSRRFRKDAVISWCAVE